MMKLFGIVFLFFASGCTGNSQNAAQQNPANIPTVDAQLPFPVYTSFTEFEPLLRQNNDTTYVINFWATWCKPCIEELPFFEQLNQNYKSQPVKVLLVSLDFPKQIKSTLIPFIEQRKIQSAIAVLIDMDYNSWIDKVSKTWDGAIPFTLIYRGKERLPLLGEMPDYQTLKEHLHKVLD